MNDTQQTAFAATPASPFESHVVSGFRGLSAEVLPRLNESLGTAVFPALFDRMLRQYRDFEKRDPTVGEIRLLDALVRLSADRPERVGAGEMITESGETAAVWADAMRRRALLTGSGSAPCTLPELLGLTARFLSRTGARRASPEKRLFAGPYCVEDAAAAGYLPAARAALESGDVCLLASAAPLPVTAPAAGDLLILVRGASAAALTDLIHTASPRRLVAGACPLDGRPLLSAAADGLPGLTVNLDRLFENGGDDMIPRLCRGEGVLSEAPRVSMLLRVRAADLKPFLVKTEQLDLCAVTVGKVEHTGRLTVTAAGYRVASVSMTFLCGLLAPRLCSIRLPAPKPCPAPVDVAALFRLPTAEPLTGRCPLIPTAAPGAVFTAAGTAVFAASARLTDADTAYHTAVRTLLTAVSAAWAGGLWTDRMQLTVTLRGHGTRRTADGSLPAADAALWAAACGLYRASAELCLPVDVSDVRYDIPAGDAAADNLSVLVCGPAPAVPTNVPADVLLGFGTPGGMPGDTPDWAALRARLAAPVVKSDIGRAPSLADKPVPTAILPLLRKDRADELRSLAAALADRGVRCVIRPVAVKMVTPAAEPTDAAALPEGEAEPAPVPTPVPTVTEAGAASLLEACRGADLTVLALSEEDGDILLREPAFADSLTVGKRCIAVGGVCRTLARLGILPGALGADGETAPTAGRTLTADVTGRDGTVGRIVCRPDADLPVGPTDAPHLVTYHVPGVTVPDGFTASDRDLIGFAGGLPDGFPLL